MRTRLVLILLALFVILAAAVVAACYVPDVPQAATTRVPILEDDEPSRGISRGQSRDPDACQTVSSTDTPRDIPDLGAYIEMTSTIPIALPGYVTTISLTLNIEQRIAEDLSIWLEYPNPSGLETGLWYGYVDGPNFTNTTFSSDAVDYTWDATAPFTGEFIPDQGYFWYGGLAAGNWELHIQDTYYEQQNDGGTLLNWSLTVCSTNSTPVATPGPSFTPTTTPTPTSFATRSSAWTFYTDNEAAVPGDWDTATGSVVANITPSYVVSGTQTYIVSGNGSYLTKTWTSGNAQGAEVAFDMYDASFSRGNVYAEASDASDGTGMHWRLYVDGSGDMRLDYLDCQYKAYTLSHYSLDNVKATMRVIWTTNVDGWNSILVYWWYPTGGYWQLRNEYQCPSKGTEAENDVFILGSRAVVTFVPTLGTPATYYDRTYIGGYRAIATPTPTATLAGTAIPTMIATPAAYDWTTDNEAAVPGDFDGYAGAVSQTPYWSTDGSYSYSIGPDATNITKTLGSGLSGGDLTFSYMLAPGSGGTVGVIASVSDNPAGSSPHWQLRRSGAYLYLDYLDCAQSRSGYLGAANRATSSGDQYLKIRVVWDTDVAGWNTLSTYTYCDADNWPDVVSDCGRNYGFWRPQYATYQCPATGLETDSDVLMFGNPGGTNTGAWLLDEVSIAVAVPTGSPRRAPLLTATATPANTVTPTYTPIPTITPTPKATVEITPIYDTYISIYTPDETHGSEVVVKESSGAYYPLDWTISDVMRGLFAFDLTGYTSAQIRSAQLKLYVRQFYGLGGPGTGRAYVSFFRITNPLWNEDATWNSTGSFGTWNWPGMGWESDYTWSRAIMDIEIDAVGWITLDVGEMLRDSLNYAPGYFAVLVTEDGIQPLED